MWQQQGLIEYTLFAQITTIPQLKGKQNIEYIIFQTPENAIEDNKTPIRIYLIRFIITPVYLL